MSLLVILKETWTYIGKTKVTRSGRFVNSRIWAHFLSIGYGWWSRWTTREKYNHTKIRNRNNLPWHIVKINYNEQSRNIIKDNEKEANMIYRNEDTCSMSDVELNMMIKERKDQTSIGLKFSWMHKDEVPKRESNKGVNSFDNKSG